MFPAGFTSIGGVFAASAATVVATGKSVEEQRLRENIAASEQERRRWVRELHDETLQSRVGLSSARRGTEEAMRAAVEAAVESLAERTASSEHESTLRRLVQESLTNAGASRSEST